MNKGHTMANTAAMIKAQDAADAAAWQVVKNDPVDPVGFFAECNFHPEHPGHLFLTYCVICPEGKGHGKWTEAAQAEYDAVVRADWDEVPF